MSLQARKTAAAEHGQYIYAYCHKRTNQVLYSLHRTLDPHQSLKQLPDLGANNTPPKLRRDLWLPLFTVAFPRAFPERPSPLTSSSSSKLSSSRSSQLPANTKPLPHANDNPLGLLAYRKLREWRKLHEYHWTPPASLAKSYTEEEYERVKEHIEQRGGAKKERPLDVIAREKHKIRVAEVQDQKANSVADLAAVLGEIEVQAVGWEEGVRGERWAEVKEMVALRAEAKSGGLEKLEEEIERLRVWAGRKEGGKGEEGGLRRRDAIARLWKLERKRARMAFAIQALEEGEILGEAVEGVRRELHEAIQLTEKKSDERMELVHVSEAVARAGQQIIDNDGALDTVREWIQQANAQLQQKEDAERAAQEAAERAAEQARAERRAAQDARREAKYPTSPSIRDRLTGWMSSKPDNQQITKSEPQHSSPSLEQTPDIPTSTLSDAEATTIRHEIRGYELALQKAELEHQNAAQRAEVIVAVQELLKADLQEEASRKEAQQINHQEAIEDVRRPRTPALWLEEMRSKTAERIAGLSEQRHDGEYGEAPEKWRNILESNLELLDAARNLVQQAQAGTTSAQEDLERQFVAAQQEWKMCKIWLAPRKDEERLEQLQRKAEVLRFAVAAVRGVEADRVDINERGEVKGVVVAAKAPVDWEKKAEKKERKREIRRTKARKGYADPRAVTEEGEARSRSPPTPPPPTQVDRDVRTVSQLLNPQTRLQAQSTRNTTTTTPPASDLDQHLTLFPAFPADPYPASTTPPTLKTSLLATRAASARRSALLHTPPLPFRMSDVRVRFANFLDAEFATQWPADMSVESMGVAGLKRMPGADEKDEPVWGVVEAREARVSEAVKRKEEREGVVRGLVERVVGAVRGRGPGPAHGKDVEVVSEDGEEKELILKEEKPLIVEEEKRPAVPESKI